MELANDSNRARVRKIDPCDHAHAWTRTYVACRQQSYMRGHVHLPYKVLVLVLLFAKYVASNDAHKASHTLLALFMDASFICMINSTKCLNMKITQIRYDCKKIEIYGSSSSFMKGNDAPHAS
jgi:hypothetical protein